MSQVLFVLSGSIACYKACDAISQLVQRGHRVRAVATQAALKFVGVATLEGLTREKVGVDLFEPGAALDHIELERWADVTIVCPATANTLNRAAAGIGDDLAGALLLAHDWKKPLLIAPAMNPAMWSHPATVASVQTLERWGARFVRVGSGRTACGEVGEGRLAEPEEIVAAIEAALARPARRRRVLVTSGGTVEPIDRVRVLANTSTGETGALIARHLARCGHDVVLLRARTAPALGAAGREETFETFADLDAALDRWLGTEDFDAVVHAAAVSDFALESIEVEGAALLPGRSKIGSDVAPTLRLRRNPKLLETLKRRSRKKSTDVVAFKLTVDASPEEKRAAVMALFASGAVDFVVHNDVADKQAGAPFPAEIWNGSGTVVAQCADRTGLAQAIERLLTREGTPAAI
jgi:phosphopantothenoylcysteine decarboxylase/phosphopantothenate--cysteine ligase